MGSQRLPVSQPPFPSTRYLRRRAELQHFRQPWNVVGWWLHRVAASCTAPMDPWRHPRQGERVGCVRQRDGEGELRTCSARCCPAAPARSHATRCRSAPWRTRAPHCRINPTHLRTLRPQRRRFDHRRASWASSRCGWLVRARVWAKRGCETKAKSARAPLPAYQQAQRHGVRVLRHEGEVDTRKSFARPPKPHQRESSTTGTALHAHGTVRARRDRPMLGGDVIGAKACVCDAATRFKFTGAGGCVPLGMDGPRGDASPAKKERSCVS